MEDDPVAKARAIAAKLSVLVPAGGGGSGTEPSGLGKRKSRWGDDSSSAAVDNGMMGGHFKREKLYIPVHQFPDINFMGLLIGPKGANQKSLEERTGAKVIIRGIGTIKDASFAPHPDDHDDPHVTLEGSEHSIAMAAQEIQAMFVNPHEARARQQQMERSGFGMPGTSAYGPGGASQEVEIWVPDHMVGLIIGKGGENIKRLTSTTGTNVQIEKEGEMHFGSRQRRVTLKGPSAQGVAQAKADIEAMIRERQAAGDVGPGSAPPPRMGMGMGMGGDGGYDMPVATIALKIPNEKVGLIIGRAGITIKGIQDSTGARVQIPPEPDREDPSIRTITVTGPNQECAERCQVEIFALLDANARENQAAGPPTVQYIAVPNEKVGLVIGKSGSIIKDIQTRLRVRLTIPTQPDPGSYPPMNTVTINGNGNGPAQARFEIEQLLNTNAIQMGAPPLYPNSLPPPGMGGPPPQGMPPPGYGQPPPPLGYGGPPPGHSGPPPPRPGPPQTFPPPPQPGHMPYDPNSAASQAPYDPFGPPAQAHQQPPPAMPQQPTAPRGPIPVGGLPQGHMQSSMQQSPSGYTPPGFGPPRHQAVPSHPLPQGQPQQQPPSQPQQSPHQQGQQLAQQPSRNQLPSQGGGPLPSPAMLGMSQSQSAPPQQPQQPPPQSQGGPPQPLGAPRPATMAQINQILFPLQQSHAQQQAQQQSSSGQQGPSSQQQSGPSPQQQQGMASQQSQQVPPVQQQQQGAPSHQQQPGPSQQGALSQPGLASQQPGPSSYQQQQHLSQQHQAQVQQQHQPQGQQQQTQYGGLSSQMQVRPQGMQHQTQPQSQQPQPLPHIQTSAPQGSMPAQSQQPQQTAQIPPHQGQMQSQYPTSQTSNGPSQQFSYGTPQQPQQPQPSSQLQQPQAAQQTGYTHLSTGQQQPMAQQQGQYGGYPAAGQQSSAQTQPPQSTQSQPGVTGPQQSQQMPPPQQQTAPQQQMMPGQQHSAQSQQQMGPQGHPSQPMQPQLQQGVQPSYSNSMNQPLQQAPAQQPPQGQSQIQQPQSYQQPQPQASLAHPQSQQQPQLHTQAPQLNQLQPQQVQSAPVGVDSIINSAQVAAQQVEQQQTVPPEQKKQDEPSAPVAATTTEEQPADPAAAEAPTDPTAYYEDFWNYVAYYGEEAARTAYGPWAPPVGTPNPHSQPVS